MKKISGTMDKLTLEELKKIVGSQSAFEIESQIKDAVGVNFFFCSNANPCDTLDVFACTGTQPTRCR
ncbi:MAG: hypothetical protein JW783_02665 [Bacteroidales bacterium]|nr:hypothetical protein [Bacteroidales bacterium]MBN2748210.1 hypothetical protein [Bacteroidales bacterium]